MKMYMVILADPEDGSQKAHFFNTFSETLEYMDCISSDYKVEVYIYDAFEGYKRTLKL